MDRISIVIPTYNAAGTLPRVLEELQTHIRKVWGEDFEIIIVNDGSTDNTLQVLHNAANQANIRVFHHHINKGYGAALKTGIHNASGDIIVTFDADGQHNPADIPKLVQPVIEGSVDMAAGARQGFIHSHLLRMPGKWFLGWLANFLSGVRIPDLNCGLRAFKKSIVSKYLHLCPDGFSFSTTATLAFINRGYAVKFVPIYVRKCQSVHRSKVTVATGFTTVLLVFRLMTLFNPLRVFLPASFFCIGIGLAWGMRYLLLGRGLSTTALLFLLAGVIIFFFGLLADQIAELRKEKYE